jgi:hypothetical protein
MVASVADDRRFEGWLFSPIHDFPALNSVFF